MAVKLRLMRLGRRHRPFFRINAVESRNPRDGKVIEKLGHYDPIEKDLEKQIVLDRERVQYWLDKGAIPSDTVSQILLRHGIKHKYAEETAARRGKARAIARAKGKPFNEDERAAAKKQAEAAEEKAKEEEKAKAEPKSKEKTEVAAKPAEAKPQAETKAEEKPKPEPAKEKPGAEPAGQKVEAEQEEKPQAEAEPTNKKKETEPESEEKPEEKQQ